ncbi:PREDICTED: uncharacterized protein LOC104774205 [Camelina sativa]|uniref:Uncharacterized protein LOC104717326 n=1 Tax=Camelina sativa TaxID=90675 RepID=A0ABM0Y8F8_CAMSA|nr:PREDICTED: uncharacterized protein LOC104717326 [Camelina sativa]XP_010497165.1 PREDICTED: uncharacterized protein LOC104774205 [Camelina sativa]
MASMNHNIVVDISSDEEVDDKRVVYSGSFDGILEISDEKPKSTDLSHLMVKNKDGDDDDCVILDCDPTAKENVVDTCGTGTDEVLVVGQKGEIACRDFPHPRHACAKYPFNSTLHEQFCEMCHCYVCDTRAPCTYWLSSLSILDHCHANDKDQMWNNQRESLRTGKILPRVVSKPALTKVQCKRVSRPISLPMPRNSSTPVTQFGIQACSTTTTKFATHPNVYTYTRRGHGTRQSKTTLPKHPGTQPRDVQSLLPKNRGGGSYNGNPSPQAVPSDPLRTRRLSRGVSHPENNGVQNIAQVSQAATCYISPADYRTLLTAHKQLPVTQGPPTASQGNSQQRIVTGYVSNLTVSHMKEMARHFNRNMYSGNVQTNEVPSMTPNPPAANQQQQQQSGTSNDKLLSEFEDWLLDDSSMVCPLSGQDNATRAAFDFETFLKK